MKTVSKQTLQFYLQQIKPLRGLYLAMTISMVIAVLLELFIPIYYKEIFDLMIEAGAPSQEVVRELLFLILSIFGVEVGMNLCYRFNEFSNNRFQPRVMKSIADTCFEYMNRHSYRFFADHFSGSLVRKINRLVRSFENFADRIYWDMTNLVIRVVGTITIIWWFSPLIGAIMLGWTLLFMFGNYTAARWKYPADVKSNAMDSKLSAAIADVITNTNNVDLFTSHDFEQQRFQGISTEWDRVTKYAWDRGAIINAIQSVFMVILEVLILYLFVKAWSDGTVSAGFLIVLQSYVFALFMRIWEFGRIIHDIFQAFANAQEMIEILHTPHEIQSLPNAQELIVKGAQVDFNNVHFSYAKGNPVLKHFNLQIKAGERVALVGHSGEGKSTITKLLMRFFDIQKGTISIDEQDISQVQLDSLRGNISLVPQDPVLFHRSLYDNIRYGNRTATKEQVIKAAKLANCHDFIMRTPKGYKTLVGERGIKLSGGERQRIAIARAILENAPIVVLDEATSSLDSYAEKLIQQALHRLLRGKTAIMIAHRLSTIMEADRILVIEGGKIVEEGTHQDLLKKKKGRYKQLWEIQAGGFIGE